MVSVTTGSARDRAAVSAAPSSSDSCTAAGVKGAASPGAAGARWAAATGGAAPAKTGGAGSSSGMINGRSIVGRSSSGTPGGAAKGPLSNCVCASPSTTRSFGLSSTSSCTSSPSAFAASCATERSEEHTSELQSQSNLVCRLLLEKKKHMYLSLVPRGAEI